MAIRRVPKNTNNADNVQSASDPRIREVPNGQVDPRLASGQTAPEGRPNRQRPRNVGVRMNINEQTPSKRRSAKENKKINPDSPEIKRSAKRAQGYKIKKKKKGFWRLALVYTVLFLMVFTVLLGAVSLGIYVSLIQTDPPLHDSMKLKMCLEHEVDDLKSVSVDVDKYWRDGVLYVNMTAISEEFGFVMTGDTKKRRFITNLDTEEDVRFDIGTPFAEINGTRVRLDGDVTNNDGSIFVPASFFTDYVKGINISLDEEKSVLYILRDTMRNEAGRFDLQDVSFTLKEVCDSPSISEFDLSDEIKDRCWFTSISAADLENQQSSGTP